MSVREKVLATDWEAWNHPRRAIVALAVVAGLAAFLARFVGESIPGPWVLEVGASALVILGSVLLAAAVLAAFD